MPRRPGRSSRSEPRWAEPPPGLFPGGEDLLRLLAVLSIAAAVAASCSFLSRRPSPFCDSDADPYAAAYDSCEPCPENGRCVDGKLECVHGFKRRGNRCVEDGVLTQTANKIAESLQRRICDEHARALCGQPGNILFNQLEISNMADELLSNDPACLTDDGIRVVKDRVLQSAHGFLETTLTDNKAESFTRPTGSTRRRRRKDAEAAGEEQQVGAPVVPRRAASWPLPRRRGPSPPARRARHRGRRRRRLQLPQPPTEHLLRLRRRPLRRRLRAEAFKCPDLVAELHRPLDCQVRQWISRNVVFMMASCILFAALLRILWSVYKRRALSKRAEQIYEQVCEILEDNAINAKIGNSGCEPWVVTSWLRDHLLVTRERRDALLWNKVEELILEDSRIDQYPKVIKGESKVVLEWQAGGSLSGKKKKMRDSAGKTRSSSVGAIKPAEEICGSSSSNITDKEQISARREGTNANFM